MLERNLVDELARTQELLKSATSLTDTLAVENHLEQLRTRLDQVRGNLQYMRDHVERAVLSVHLVAQGAETPIVRPEAGLFPSLRGTVALDWRKAGQPDGYAGGGVSLSLPSFFGVPISRGLSFDVDVLTQAFGGVPIGGNLAFLAVGMAGDANGPHGALKPSLGLVLAF